MGRPKKDISGKKFGKLTAIKRVGSDKRNISVWLCKCDCGNEKEVSMSSLRPYHNPSCGCNASRKTMGQRFRTHGKTKTAEHNTWLKMKERCYYPNSKNYQGWGSRGIKICDRWLNSFENFFADMGKRPSSKHSIDRYPNNDGDYEPGNCRWATMSEQRRNQGDALIVEYKSIKKPLANWCEELGLRYQMIWRRIQRGYSIVDAFEKRARVTSLNRHLVNAIP